MTVTAMDRADSAESWALAIDWAARSFDLSPSVEQIKLALLASATRSLRSAVAPAAQLAGLNAVFIEVKGRPSELSAPFLIELAGGGVGVVTRWQGDDVDLVLPSRNGAIERRVQASALRDSLLGLVLVVAPRVVVRDRRIDEFLAPYRPSWFRNLLTAHAWRYLELASGAFFGNILALATAIFAMQIWDRVIPAQSEQTLWVLTLGVAIALIAELLIKLLRTSLSDRLGKQLDLQMSSMFFARALDLRNDKRPRSPGTLIAQLRELDQIRELITSSTLTVLFEIPFVVTFILVVALIGGPLAYVLLAVVPVVLILCLVAQWPLAKLARMGLRESALRNAMLVEAVERIEDIKSLQAEARFGATWESLNRESARISMKTRYLGALLTNATLTLQQLAYVAVLVAGVYLVLDNAMTTGALLACSMLTSRAIAPLAGIAGVFVRWQAAKSAREGLDKLLQLPVDHGSRERFSRPLLKPDLDFDQISHVYEEGRRPALQLGELTIRAGEKVALIGRIGSGKSTLLKLASGLMPPSQGRVVIDGCDMAAVDLADIRRDIGSFHQDAGLFVGTVRSNLRLGAPTASDETLLAALSIIGPAASIFAEGSGLDMTIAEGGRGLSSGQRQALLLARTLARAPRALLLDEPTGSMDENTERTFVANLRQWLGPRTLIVATHRYALLDAVDRVIVLEQGRIVLDGPRAEVVKRMSGTLPGAAPVASPHLHTTAQGTPHGR